MKRKIILFALVQCSTPIISSYDALGDVPAAHKLQQDLRQAHRAKLRVLQRADKRNHLERVATCHGALCHLNRNADITNSAHVVDEQASPECTSTRCKVMRLVNQISFNVQELMKQMRSEDIVELSRLNQKIHELKIQLKKLSIEDETFKEHPIALYF